MSILQATFHTVRCTTLIEQQTQHPPAVKLHKSLVGTIKDLERGQLVADDVEGWTPHQVKRF